MWRRLRILLLLVLCCKVRNEKGNDTNKYMTCLILNLVSCLKASGVVTVSVSVGGSVVVLAYVTDP